MYLSTKGAVALKHSHTIYPVMTRMSVVRNLVNKMGHISMIIIVFLGPEQVDGGGSKVHKMVHQAVRSGRNTRNTGNSISLEGLIPAGTTDAPPRPRTYHASTTIRREVSPRSKIPSP